MYKEGLCSQVKVSKPERYKALLHLCFTYNGTLCMQTDTVRDRSKKLRKILLSDAKAAFNMAFVEEEVGFVQ